MTWCRQIWRSQKGHKWRHNMAHARCMLEKQGYTHARSCTRPRCWAPARARAHTDICNTYCYSTAAMVSRTRLSVTLYVFCLFCFFQLQLLCVYIARSPIFFVHIFKKKLKNFLKITVTSIWVYIGLFHYALIQNEFEKLKFLLGQSQGFWDKFTVSARPVLPAQIAAMCQ
jgi:hypothetical protein